MLVGDGLAGAAAFASWSGGKDSALALHRAIEAGARPELLLTMMVEGGGRSRSHGLSRAVLEAQAAAIGLPIRFGAASWAEYGDRYAELIEAEATARGLGVGIFGDIDIEDHRGWVEALCARVGARAVLPLWQQQRAAVMADLLGAGFRARIVAVRDGVLSPELLGETIDAETLPVFARAGADLAGEEGEYHSVVVDGPIFQRPLALEPGEPSLRDGVWFLDFSPAVAAPA